MSGGKMAIHEFKSLWHAAHSSWTNSIAYLNETVEEPGGKFGQLLRKVRVHAHLSLSEAAKKLGISTQYLCEVERGRKGPLAHHRIEQAAKLYEVGAGPLHIAKVLWEIEKGRNKCR